jgi:hypothetical protein
MEKRWMSWKKLEDPAPGNHVISPSFDGFPVKSLSLKGFLLIQWHGGEKQGLESNFYVLRFLTSSSKGLLGVNFSLFEKEHASRGYQPSAIWGYQSISWSIWMGTPKIWRLISGFIIRKWCFSLHQKTLDINQGTWAREEYQTRQINRYHMIVAKL